MTMFCMIRAAYPLRWGFAVPVAVLIAVPVTVLMLFLSAPLAAADQTDPRLEPLFDQLSASQSPESAAVISSEIWRLWLESDSAGARILMREGMEAMHSGRMKEALMAFDALVQLSPDFAEGWNKRATVRFYIGDLEGSVADIKRTLALEPRHFGAFSGLGMIYEAWEQPEDALKAYQEAARHYPLAPHTKARIEAIEKQLRDSRI